MKAISLNRILMILAFAGLFVASYIAIAHYVGANIACGVEDGCGKVASSRYARFLGIPVANFGVGAYAMFLVLAVIRNFGGDEKGKWSRVGLFLSGFGVVVSLVLIYLSLVVIQATCWWCVASAMIMIFTFVLHALLVRELPLAGTSDALLFGVLSLVLVASIFGMSTKLDPILKPVPGVTVEQLFPGYPDHPLKDAHILGEDNAPVVIVEFFDLTCVHCMKSYLEFKDMINNKHCHLKVIFRHFPLVKVADHEMALPAAVLSEMCAEKGHFFEFVDSVYSMPTKDLTIDKLFELAAVQGVPIEEARKRLLDKDDPAFVRATTDFNKGNELGISVTPTFYVGMPGKQVYPAKQDSLRKILMTPQFQPLWDPTFTR